MSIAESITSRVRRSPLSAVTRHPYDRFAYYLLSVVLVLIAWEFVSLFVAPSFLPGIVPVVAKMWAIIESGEFLVHLVDTLRRVAVGFALAYGLSIPLGIAMGLDQRAEYFFEMPILIGISVPGLAIAVLAIIWFGLSELTAYVSVFILATPMIVFNFWQGTKSLDVDLLEMGRIFEATPYMMVREIVLPSLLPHLLAAARFGLALSWKIVVIVELLGMTSGIGYMINNAFQLYLITGVLAWTLDFTLVMVFIEFGILKSIERRVTAWRGTSDVQQEGLRG